MFSFKSIVLIAAAFTIGAESSAVPAVAAAPLIAPAAVGYAQTIPQNIPPFASQVSVVNKAVAPLVAAPLAAAPYLAGPVPAPYAAPYAAPYVAGPAPYIAGPAPYVAGPVAAAAPYVAGPAPYAAAPLPYAAPFPYSAPLLRSPYVAPAFVR